MSASPGLRAWPDSRRPGREQAGEDPRDLWKPGSASLAGLAALVRVSPTGAPCTSLIAARDKSHLAAAELSTHSGA